MYIVAIAWLYVVILMALTSSSFTRGLVTVVVYGLAPLALLLWLMGAPHRRRLRERASMPVRDQSHTPDQHDAQRDQ
jgi:hypothetical protein